MTPVDLLHATRIIIAVPERWCQRYCALDGFDLPVQSDSVTACRWCIRGALGLAAKAAGIAACSGAYPVAERALTSFIPDRLLSPWNDAPERTHAEVMALIDLAITSLEPHA